MRVRLLSASAMIVAAACLYSVNAELTTKFSGDALYRWQYDHFIATTDSGKEVPTVGDLTHKYSWNFRLSATVNENLSVNVRFSNPSGFSTDKVSSTLNLAGPTGVGNVVTVPEFCFKWNAGILTLSGGIIPVGLPPVTNTVLDLVAYEAPGGVGSIPGGYVNAGAMPWYVATNGSLIGLDLLLNFYKSDPFSVGLDVIAAMGADSGKVPSGDIIKKDQLRFVGMIPMSLLSGMIAVTPSMHLRTNVYRSADLEKGNSSITGGIDVSAKPVKILSVKAGFAAGSYSNDSKKGEPLYAATATAPMGLLVNAGVALSPGFGKGVVDFAWGNWKDREQKPDVASFSQIYFDIYYDCPVKSLVFRPRIRIWDTTNDLNDKSALTLRPELDFIAKF